MTNRYLISVAVAALIAGSGFANAQGTGGMSREAPPSGASTQQNSTSSERGSAATPMSRDASQSGAPAEAPKSAQSREMDRDGSKNQRAQDTAPGQKSKSMSSDNEKAGTSREMKAEDRNGNTNRAEDRNGNMNRADDRNGSRSTTTTGQAGAGAKLSTEQRTRITTVIRSQHIQPVTNVNFSISVGTRIPRNVGFHPLPTEIITVYPQWRGYEFFVVNDQIVVVDPRTLEIVDVIDA